METRTKYPRTYHFPWSPGSTSDDKTHSPEDVVRMFEGREVVVTEKMDGENTTLYSDGTCHARSLDSGHHESRAWVKSLAGTLAGEIPPGWRICGENVYACHSVGYDALPSYFLIFGIYDEHNVCLSWDDTVEWAHLLGLVTVPTLYRGPFPGEYHLKMALETRTARYGTEAEGYVCRLAEAFPFDAFAQSVAKYVRAGHVTTDTHWMHQAIVPNKLV